MITLRQTLSLAICVSLLVANAPVCVAQDRSPLSFEANTVLRKMRSDRLTDPGSLTEQLARLVTDAPEGLFEVLSSRKVPALSAEVGAQRLSEPQEHLLLGAFELLGKARCGGLLGDLEADAEESERVSLVRLLGVVGDERDVPRMFQVASRAEPFSKRMLDAVRLALTDTLDRGGHGIGHLKEQVRFAPLELASAAIRALGGRSDRDSMDVLEVALSGRRELAAVALSQVSKWQGVAGSAPGSMVSRVRELLDDERDAVRSQAALACGALGDEGAVEPLVRLIDDAHRGVGIAAHHALEQIGGVRRARSSASWQRWFEHERRWATKMKATAYRSIASTQLSNRAQAKMQIVEHRLYRHESVRVMIDLLETGGPDVRLTAVECLIELGTPSARQRLLKLRQDDDPRIRERLRD